MGFALAKFFLPHLLYILRHLLDSVRRLLLAAAAFARVLDDGERDLINRRHNTLRHRLTHAHLDTLLLSGGRRSDSDGSRHTTRRRRDPLRRRRHGCDLALVLAIVPTIPLGHVEKVQVHTLRLDAVIKEERREAGGDRNVIKLVHLSDAVDASHGGGFVGAVPHDCKLVVHAHRDLIRALLENRRHDGRSRLHELALLVADQSDVGVETERGIAGGGGGSRTLGALGHIAKD